jgi:hypothetical protein
MTKAILKILVGLVGVLYMALWIALMLTPQAMVDQFSLVPQGIVGLSSMRANVGVLFFAGSILCFLYAWGGARHWLITASLLTGGAALGRLIGFSMEGVSEQAMTGFVFECVILVIFSLAYFVPESKVGEVNSTAVS